MDGLLIQDTSYTYTILILIIVENLDLLMECSSKKNMAPFCIQSIFHRFIMPFKSEF